ncbi:hypothetical protein CS379_08575 [Methylobacterium frigidaeris]|uniref:Uncharacterized protein n=2 Tax=Methylobacterium frigidaeris TaxID=2038277 RepID=A0AA37H7L1_9HYPH|nr:hypothetical protein CS379_08575 [Methylobacterium frigidaeris]GJD60873.1 hypothetical protein MPEAHAMD_1013 [Methylobacterium frigidaeris]
MWFQLDTPRWAAWTVMATALRTRGEAKRKGAMLFRIDERDDVIAVQQAEAAVERARAQWRNSVAEAVRRNQLSDLALTIEEKETYHTAAPSNGRVRRCQASPNGRRR